MDETSCKKVVQHHCRALMGPIKEFSDWTKSFGGGQPVNEVTIIKEVKKVKLGLNKSGELGGDIL